jgi:hypothetical protein
LDSLAHFKPKGGEEGQVIEGPLTQSGLEQLLTTDPFRPTLSQTVGVQDVWPFLIVICGTIFFADVLVRRVALRFDWIGAYISEFKSRRPPPDIQHSMARLQSRKAEIEKEIASKRAKTRFAPETDENASGRVQLEKVIGDEIDEIADRRRPKKQDTSLDVVQEEQSYTSRLLDAKRKAQKKQNRPDDAGQ